MEKARELIINGIMIPPGKRMTIMLPMPKLYDWTPMNMPIHVINGKTEGPVLCVTAALHGDEINGIEIIRRLLKKRFTKNLHGALIAVPIVNIYGFLYQDRYLMDRRDLNRAFPGSNKGSLAARLAYLIMNELVANATHFIDLHTGSLQRTNLPQIRANLDLPQTEKLAKAFNAPVILHSKFRDGSLRQAANDRGVPLLLYEAGEALRFNEAAIKIGLQGILNVMQTLNMLNFKNNISSHHPPIARFSLWIRAPHSGILKTHKSLGKKIKKGEILGVIVNPIGEEEYLVKSRISGMIIGQTNLPLVHEGAALFHIGSFKPIKELAPEVIEEAHQEELTPWIEQHD
ncbi:MAG: succinylglutamate desuccinylase/aspartoacylase family protein [Proteobacteria bacterium]|nr:succinylglutamate desuccinylase/aspartoacylase family protein [Pseudomonadota bacterium]